MRRRRIRIARFGPVERGKWCETCLLPSATLVRLILVQGLKTSEPESFLWCSNCEVYVATTDEPRGESTGR